MRINIELCENVRIVEVLTSVPHGRVFFIENRSHAEPEYWWFEPWDDVRLKDAAEYINDPDNTERGTSGGEFATLGEAIKDYFC